MTSSASFVSVHKHAKKEPGQYPAILTSRLVNNPYEIVEKIEPKYTFFRKVFLMRIPRPPKF